jgi:hypothetical protein
MYTRDGSVSAHMYGPEPSGVLLYTPDGGVSATIQSAAGGGELAVVYAGRVTLAEDVLTHRVLVGSARFPAGAELVRYAALTEDGDLVLTVKYPDGATKYTLGWRAAAKT